MTDVVASLQPFAVLDQIEAGVIVLDDRFAIRHWNTCMRHFSGIAPDDVLGKPIWDHFPGLRDTLLHTAVEDALAFGAPSVLSHALHPMLFPLWCKDGRPMLHDVMVRRFTPESGSYCLIQIRDVTEHRHTHEMLARSRAHYGAAFDGAAIGICEIDPNGRFIRVNDRFCKILGYTRRELLARSLQDVTFAEDREASLALFRRAFAGAIPSFSIERRYIRKDGSPVWGNLTCSVVHGADGHPALAIGTIEDISRRKKSEDEREQLLSRQDLLMREVHHRVKNSLAMVASLLSIQNRTIADPAARAHLTDAYHRVLAIAQVHERLYRTSHVDHLELGTFLKGLCHDLERSIMSLERGQKVIVAVDAEIELPFEKALPLAIIVSELVTNAFKHARPDGSAGRVFIECARCDTGPLRLTVSDDGVGLPDGFDPAGTQSLGMRIVTGFGRQLKAAFEARNTGIGAEFTLQFEP